VDERDAGLSERSATILGLIAEGRSYDQILQQQPAVTYFDIFAAAREALDLLQAPATCRLTTEAARADDAAEADSAAQVARVAGTTGATRAGVGARVDTAAEGEVLSAVSRPSFVERARATHGRAWTRWTNDEDARLAALFRKGESRAEIVRQLGRQPGAVERRLVKLGLVTDGGSAGASASRETSSQVPGTIEAPNRPNRAPTPPMVPGWEALRDRLTPHREIT
jgi:hypothetical protein